MGDPKPPILDSIDESDGENIFLFLSIKIDGIVASYQFFVIVVILEWCFGFGRFDRKRRKFCCFGRNSKVGWHRFLRQKYEQRSKTILKSRKNIRAQFYTKTSSNLKPKS
jgi:predicted amidophosphoribosyltransferase